MVRTFGYYGGKQSKLRWLLPKLPPSKVYAELFGGTFSVYLNRRPRSKINILNDKDDLIVNLFMQIRDNSDELARRISLTPFSRSEFLACRAQDAACPIERARQTLVCICQGILHSTNEQSWGMSSDPRVDKAGFFRRLPQRIKAMVEPFRYAMLECADALKIATLLIDENDVLVYADPPYLHDTRVAQKEYRHEMSRADHEALLRVLSRCRGKVAISGYENDLYASVLAGWHVERLRTHSRVTGQMAGSREPRVECLWMNYDPSFNRDLL